jgi:antitoxin (DNA-binding transcriptional repressor) of toxin-antitoxin stability system
MTPLTATEFSKRTGEVHRALRRGEEVPITFRGKPYARVFADDWIQQERAERERQREQLERQAAELEALRAELATLRSRAGEVLAV